MSEINLLLNYQPENKHSLRQAFGQELVNIGHRNPNLIVLDAEVGNSTYTNLFEKSFPDRFVQNFIAEQNMLSASLGLSISGKIPVASTFAAFLTRAADQIRMAQYSAPKANLKIVGTHCGVSIGEDGPSQMALEDISMFRCILDSVVVYPSDVTSCQKLLNLIIDHYTAVSYLRVTRGELPQIYDHSEEFQLGGSKTLVSSSQDQVTIIAAGITLHEAIKAAQVLGLKGIDCRVIDLYSIKPLDLQTLSEAYSQTDFVIVVEDHFREGGIYEAVCSSGVATRPTYSLSVTKTPRSGKPEELLAYEEIDSDAIVDKVLSLIA